jgi:hypothetical protein
MRRISTALFAAAFAIVVPLTANANGVRRHQGPAAHGGQGKCAAIAISLEAKDAWGAQSLKDTCEGAENDALQVCEATLASYGFPKNCVVRSTRDWIVGIYCRTESGKASPGIGIGRTELEAMSDAVQDAGSALALRCWAPAIRHGSIAKETFYMSNWHIRTSCGSASARGEHKGFRPLSIAIRQCGRQPISNCRVTEARYN